MPDLLNMSLEELGKIKITVASHFPTSELESGSVVSVVTADDWRRAGARRTSDALSHQPATLVLPFILSTEAIAIRGYAKAQGVASLLDGVPLTNYAVGTALVNVRNLELGVLDRIEVMRGPASALYGSDAFHGVVAYNTFASSADLTQAETALGSDGFYRADLAHSRPVTDTVRANLALAASGLPDQHRSYGFTDPATGAPGQGERALKYDSQTGVFKLISDQDRPTRWNLGFYWGQNRADQSYGVGRVGTPTSVLGAMDLSGTETDFAMTRLNVSHALAADITANVQAFFWQTQRDYLLRVTQANAVGEQDSTEQTQRDGVKLTLQQEDNPWNTSWAVAAGYDQAQVGNAHTQERNADGVLLRDADDLIEGLDRHIDILELEAHTRLLNERLQLVYGGRIDRYSEFGQHSSPRLGVIVLPQSPLLSGVALKLLYSHAFRAPAAAEVVGTALLTGNPDLDPETLDSYEFVLMKQASDWKAGLTLFKNDWQDGIVVTNRRYVNIGENRSRGATLSWGSSWHPWMTDLSASWVQSEDVTNHRNYGAFPKWVFNLGGGYALADALRISLNNRIHYHTDEGPTSALHSDPEPLPHYWRTDLHIEQDASRELLVWLDLRNLFDRDNSLPSLLNAEGGVPDESLNLSIGMRYRF